MKIRGVRKDKERNKPQCVWGGGVGGGGEMRKQKGEVKKGEGGDGREIETKETNRKDNISCQFGRSVSGYSVLMLSNRRYRLTF